MPTPQSRPDLLRHAAALRVLAQALLRDPQAAEDAVQDAYAQALDRPPQRSVGGWLAAVVRNFALQRRRSDARRRRREQVAARPEAVVATDVAAMRCELLHRLVEAVHELPEPYRDSVWARWFEELPPAAIAQRDGVPVATVKSRLQRGLAMLRARLDGDGGGGDWRAGLATAFGIGNGVRVGVGAAAATGVLLMGTAAKIAIGGVLAAAVGLFWWAAGSAAVPPGKAAAHDATPTVVAAEAMQSDLAAPQRIEAAVASEVAVDDPLLAHLRGRCVDEHAQPLAGARAQLLGRERNFNSTAMPGTSAWHDPKPITVGEDGRFSFAFAPPAGLQFVLSIDAEHRVPRRAHWQQIEPAQVFDLGDITMAVGHHVRGRVVDEQGVAIAKVSLSVDQLPLPLSVEPGGSASCWASSRSDGTFDIAGVPDGTWPMHAQKRGFELVSPTNVTVAAQDQELPVTLRSLPSIEGIVVDEQGAPVSGVMLQAGDQQLDLLAMATSLSDGSFAVYSRSVEPAPVRMRLSPFNRGAAEAVVGGDRQWPWGSRDVRVVVRRTLSVQLTVVERKTGAPVCDYAVSCCGVAARWSSGRDLRLAGTHENGRVTVDGVRRGRNELQVMPIDPSLRPSATIAFEATDAGAPAMRVELDRMQPAVVRVHTADGTAVAAAKVEVIAKGTMPFAADTSAHDPRNGSPPFWSTNPNYRPHLLVVAAWTAADGHADVFLPDDDVELAVRATGRFLPTVVDGGALRQRGELDVEVARDSGIVGKVRVAGLDLARVTVQVQPVGAQDIDGIHRGDLRGDGAFALHGVAPGTYRVTLAYAIAVMLGGARDYVVPLDLDLPEVVVREGKDTKVDLDATKLVPASLCGRLLLDGAPAPAARVFVCGEGRGPRYGELALDADGVFEVACVLPGTYRVGFLLDGDTSDPVLGLLMQDDTFTLAPGQQLTRDFAFTHRRLVLSVLQPDGQTPATAQYLQASGSNFRKMFTTDAAGKAVIDPAPAGSIQLWTSDGRALPAVEVPPGQAEHSVTLTLPKKK